MKPLLKLRPWLLVLFAVSYIPTYAYANFEEADQALNEQKYERAKILYQQYPGFRARFGEGTACYRLKDFNCAQSAFSAAAWQAENQTQRAHAVFNLGNTYFFSGDFKQATILFSEAAQLGIDENIVGINIEFAKSLAKSVQTHLESIKNAEEKAEWRSQARSLAEDFLEHVVDGIYLSRPQQDAITLHTLSVQEIQQIVSANIGRNSTTTKNIDNNHQAQWIKSSQEIPNRNTAALFNILMPMEIGLPAGAKSIPYQLKDHRPW